MESRILHQLVQEQRNGVFSHCITQVEMEFFRRLNWGCKPIFSECLQL